MSDPSQLPDPDEVSSDYLVKPTPPSHEFRFKLRTVLLMMIIAAMFFGLIRLAMH